MNRILTVLGALVLWAVSSALLFAICALSVSQFVMSAASFVILACLVGGLVALSTGRERWLFAIAAGPAFVVGGLLFLALLFNIALAVFG